MKPFAFIGLMLFSLQTIAQECYAGFGYFSLTFGGDTTIQCIDGFGNGAALGNVDAFIGTNKGLVQISDGNWASRKVLDSTNSVLPSNNVTCISSADLFGCWAGTNKGLCSLGSSSKLYTMSNSRLPSDSITCILGYSNDSVWIGTRNGLALYLSALDSFQVYNTTNSVLPNNHIRCIENLSFICSTCFLGTIYVGTDSGLVIIDGSNWRVYTTSNSGLTNNVINALSVIGFSNAADLWVATNGGGICEFLNNSWITYSTQNKKIGTDTVNVIEAYITARPHMVIAGNTHDTLFVKCNPGEDSSGFVHDNIFFDPVASANHFEGFPFDCIFLCARQGVSQESFAEGLNDIRQHSSEITASINNQELDLFPKASIFNIQKISIENVNGETVFSSGAVHQLVSSEVVEIPKLPAGVYLVELQTTNRTEFAETIKTQ